MSKDPHVVQSSISNTPIRTEIKATPRYEETPIKRTITVTNVKTVKSSSISGMNGRNRLYDDDLFDDDRYKSPTTRKFQGEKRDEDIRLIPKSSNIGSSKYKPVLTRVEENENKKIHIDQRKESIVNNERKFRENPDKNEDKKIKPPPSLKEIENKGIEQEENEEDKKRELMFKLQLLQKQYPLRDIPDFTIRSEYKSMKKTYDIIVKQLSVDSSVETYKNYLVGGFMVCEMVFGRIGFDMEGFTQQQLLSMNSYEKLLLELGEKTYTPAGMDKWPVEVRLALAILFNAVWFIAAKMIMKKTKINILSLFNNTKGLNKSGTTPSSVSPRTWENSKSRSPQSEFNFIGRKNENNSVGRTQMKGPSINRIDEGFGSGSDESRRDMREQGIETLK